MAGTIIHRSIFGIVRFIGEGRRFDGNLVDARGPITLSASANPVEKEEFLHRYYDAIFGDDRSYQEALEDGIGPIPDDMLPDLDRASIRAYSSFWLDLDLNRITSSPFQGNDISSDEGQECGPDDEQALRMLLTTGGSNLAFQFDLKQATDRMIAAYLADGNDISLPYAIDFLVNFFLDYEKAQGSGSLFKTVRLTTSVSPAAIQVQIIRLDGAQNLYRIVAGPSPSNLRFVKHPASALALTPDTAPRPPHCTSLIVTGNLGAGILRSELLVVGDKGEVSFVDSAENLVACRTEDVIYALQVSKEKLSLTHENTEEIDIVAMKMLSDGSLVEATEAIVSVEAADESSLLEWSMTDQSHRRQVKIWVDQVRSAKAARRSSKAILKPSDLYLEFHQMLRVTLHGGGAQIHQDLPADIMLMRWVPLCRETASEWPNNPPDLDQETHLRMNYATILQSFKDGITQYNNEETAPAGFNVRAADAFDKVRAGNFLFRHNADDEIARIYFFTRPDEVGRNETLYDEWQDAIIHDCNLPTERPPAYTEAALAVRMFETFRASGKQPLSPGDVLRLGLKETGGDIGGAMLLCHNTLRSMARQLGDGGRTGIEGIDAKLFRQMLHPIRGGSRCSDGAPGAPKAGASKEENFAGDYGGPWYHLYGTAFYEVYSVGRTEEGNPPADGGWARSANHWEQYYRENIRGRGEAPDPEKYCVNLWGIALANALLGSFSWRD